jgi:hypothetical protein
MAEPQFGVRTTPVLPPSPGAVPGDGSGEATVTESKAMSYLGWFLIFAAFAPPIAVILWRIATMQWGEG